MKIDKVGRWKANKEPYAVLRVSSLAPEHFPYWEDYQEDSNLNMDWWNTKDLDFTWTYLGPLEEERVKDVATTTKKEPDKNKLIGKQSRTDFHLTDAEGNEHHIRWDSPVSDGDLRTLATVITQVADLSEELSST